jgi:glycosyltransferase involved in cell wall biosynthesis
MPDDPLVSVVMPSYNRSATLPAAIESVLSQTYDNIELLVVDDGSTDDSVEIVSRLAATQRRVRLLRHDTNRGAQAARNTGIRAALGEWVAFLDSDDRYLPDSVERRLETVLRDGRSAVHGECLAHSSEGERLFGIPAMSGDIREALLERPGPAFPALLVRAQVLTAIGGLDESLVAYQEWDTSIRLSNLTEFSFLPEPTFIYDLRGLDTISRDARRSVQGYEQVVRKHLRAILRAGGPSLVAVHLRESARQLRIGGSRVRALQRLLLSAIVWPFAARDLARAARSLVRGTY